MFLSVPRRTNAHPGAGPRGALREAPGETDRSKFEGSCGGRARGRGGVFDRGRDGSDRRPGHSTDVGATGPAGKLHVLRADGRLEIVPPDGAVPGDGARVAARHRGRGKRAPDATAQRRGGRGARAHVPGGDPQHGARLRAVPRGAGHLFRLSAGAPGSGDHDAGPGKSGRRGALLRARRPREARRAAVQGPSGGSAGEGRTRRGSAPDRARDRRALAGQPGGRIGQAAGAGDRACASLRTASPGGGNLMAFESRLLAGPVPASLLVIDDEPQLRDFLKEALGEAGYAVEVAEDGERAIETVRRASFDVAICDLKMPGIDGLETISRIREINPDIQFIILTAHRTLDSAIEGLRIGAFDFLQKPVATRDLLFSVGKALERRGLLERMALFELSRTIFSTLDPKELYERLMPSAMQVLRADDVSLMLLDENRELYIAKSTSLDGTILAATRLALGERVAGRVAQQAEPAVINDDLEGDGRFAGVRSMRPIRAAIVCPLTMRGELLGVLNVNRVNRGARYTERDRQGATILSSIVSLALGNARLHKELQARLQQTRATQEGVMQNEKMVALRSLLSGVAHELNNPLCAVLGYGQLLQQGDLQPKLRKGVEVIVREGERAARIVADLLRFARQEKPEKRLLGLSGVLLKTLDRKSYDLRSSRIDVATAVDPELPLVLGDFRQLQVVFTNLITNAQQAMFDHHGRGTLTIKGERKGGKVVLTFADDGPGISVAHARRVFDPFFTTKAVGQGTGLGLSVCFAIVRDHGGTPPRRRKPRPGAP